jgi:protease I
VNGLVTLVELFIKKTVIMGTLSERKIAILTEDGFEEVELTSPKQALLDAGATVHIVSPKRGSVRAKEGDEWKGEYPVDKNLSEISANDYDGLLLPGGVVNPDKLRTNEEALSFVKDFFHAGKPVAAICHGPQVLIDAEVVEGRKVTSVAAIRRDLINAGAQWEDSEVVTDEGLVTSRTPQDLPAFNSKIVEEFAEGKHEGQHA